MTTVLYRKYIMFQPERKYDSAATTTYELHKIPDLGFMLLRNHCPPDGVETEECVGWWRGDEGRSQTEAVEASVAIALAAEQKAEKHNAVVQAKWEAA